MISIEFQFIGKKKQRTDEKAENKKWAATTISITIFDKK